ncbi:hypothetical protein [Tichowtungia aerotolerans]|uniref:Uncharacterized protein n=1 Tax=Tichowtungia aerotolerans TaxID=2697043 RepID=A0A6P1M9R0_9BACT|nr:hypothetical protein [Tichowtungia aerotolerans]QHI69803.1 hypothetical protein GT409_10190 [Tichowtungia aerotolerans]
MKRREFIAKNLGAGLAVSTGAICGGLPASSADLNYDSQKKWPLDAQGAVPPDEVRLLAGYIGTYHAPEGAMPRSGGWKAVYDMLKFDAPPSYKKKKVAAPVMYNSSLGQVAISRSGRDPEYHIQMAYSPTAAVEEVDGQLYCNTDDVASICNYEMTWRCSSRDPHITYLRKEIGRVGSGELTVSTPAYTDRFRIQKSLTSLWTLMDAVRFLPAQAGWKKNFDLYMDLSSLRRNQVLQYSKESVIQTAGGNVPVSFYRQLGEGIEPIHYAVDEQKRPLFITQGQLGWGLNRIEII